MNCEILMKKSLQRRWPGDERLMDRCAKVVDKTLPEGVPHFAAVIRPIVYFIESMDEGELQEEFPRLLKFLVELAQAADRIESDIDVKGKVGRR